MIQLMSWVARVTTPYQEAVTESAVTWISPRKL